MGVSTDAILCYGFSLDTEEGELPVFLSGDIEFDNFVAQLYDLSMPSCPHKSGDKEWREYFEKKSELMKQVGIDIVRHCSDGYPMYILAIKESVKTARRGQTVELAQSVSVNTEWREKLMAFCKKANLEFQEPQLILCSWYC